MCLLQVFDFSSQQESTFKKLQKHDSAAVLCPVVYISEVMNKAGMCGKTSNMSQIVYQ